MTMMKICLVRPPTAHSRTTFTSGVGIPPIGVASLAANVEKAGHTAVVIDALGSAIDRFYKISRLNVVINGLSIDEIVERIPSDVELIGLSCMFSNEWFFYELIIQQIKRLFPHVPIVVGGEHVTAEWNHLLALCPEVDFCAIGEGEETLVDLIKAIEESSDLTQVDGIALRVNGAPHRNSPRKRKKYLDEFALPDWDKIPVQNYLSAGYSFTTINRRSMPILASRGCPFTCSFCTSPQMWGTQLYFRNAKSVVDEIEFYYKKYQIEHVDFCDIVGILNETWATELLTLLKERNLPVTWLHGAGTRSEILNEKMLDLFKDSKALRIFYAPESGSKTTIKKIRKRVDLDKIKRSMGFANQRGLSMRSSLIFGFPNQTIKEAFENILFGLKVTLIGVDDVVCHIFSAHPGTEYYKTLANSQSMNLEKMILEGKYNDFLRGQVLTKIWGQKSWSEHLPDWSLPFFQIGTMALNYTIQFLVRPWRFFHSINRTLVKRKPLTLFDHVLYRIFIGPKFKIKYNLLPEYSLSTQNLLVSIPQPVTSTNEMAI